MRGRTIQKRVSATASACASAFSRTSIVTPGCPRNARTRVTRPISTLRNRSVDRPAASPSAVAKTIVMVGPRLPSDVMPHAMQSAAAASGTIQKRAARERAGTHLRHTGQRVRAGFSRIARRVHRRPCRYPSWPR